MRALIDSQNYKHCSHPLILPLKSLGVEIKKHLKGLDVLDYGLMLKDGAFKIDEYSTTLSWPLSAAYALSICTQADAKNICLAGFDGYEAYDPRQEEMEQVIKDYNLLDNAIEISSITPTSYNVKYIK